MTIIKKAVSVLLTCCLALAFLPTLSQSAYAAGSASKAFDDSIPIEYFRLKILIMIRRTKKAKSISRAKSLLLTISSWCRTCAGAFLLKIHNVLGRE